MTITSYTLTGPHNVDARPVKVSATLDPTRPNTFTITGQGLKPAAHKEIAVRVRAAMTASGIKMPSAGVVVTIDSCGDRLVTSLLDLPIALAVMCTNDRAPDLAGFLVAGELGLDGRVRRVRGAFQGALLASALGMRALMPDDNVRDAQATDAEAYTIRYLGDVADAVKAPADRVFSRARHGAPDRYDFADCRGRAAEVSTIETAIATHLRAVAAGKPSPVLLLSGAPGTGKTMLARRIPTILPTPHRDDQTQVTRVYSSLGLSDGLITERPFRAPHHTISSAALTGREASPGLAGGASYSGAPGEVHLSAHGVLFLDELTEFPMAVLESLGHALARMDPRARPMIVAATNACPCGWSGTTARECTCTPASVDRYRERLSKAVRMLTGKTGAGIRIVDVAPLWLDDMRNAPIPDASETIRARLAVVSCNACSPDGTTGIYTDECGCRTHATV